MSSKKILSGLVGKLLVLFYCDQTAQTDVLKNILPTNSILSKFSEINVCVYELCKFEIMQLTVVMCCQIAARKSVAPSSGDLRRRPAPRYACGQD